MHSATPIKTGFSYKDNVKLYRVKLYVHVDIHVLYMYYLGLLRLFQSFFHLPFSFLPLLIIINRVRPEVPFLIEMIDKLGEQLHI